MDLKGAEIRNIIDLCKEMGNNSSDSIPLKINIPYYQRPYKWDDEQIENLINDFYKNKSDNKKAEYFVGSVVLVNGKNSERHDVIDGQQRLTTIFLLNYLKFILLRAYTEECITLKNHNITSYLEKLVVCYCTLFNANKCVDLKNLYERIDKELDSINELDNVSRDEKYNEILLLYQENVGLPEKNFTDMNDYKRQYVDKIRHTILNEDIALKYSRASYNQKLKEALSRILVKVSKVENPELIVIGEEEDAIICHYVAAIKCEFDMLKKYMCTDDKPLDNVKNMINAIDEMIQNIKFCVIMTGNEKDAYTLFEVLNDRALAIDDLDLIKNIFYKKYCTNSKEIDDVIDKNIEQLDQLWVDKIFTRDMKETNNKLISYLGTIYFTANQQLFTNKAERYREIIEKEYFDKLYSSDKQYSYINVFNDITVYYMLKIIIKEFALPINNAVNAAIKAENDIYKSITYKTFHLLNALGMPGVMPALTNMVLKKYIDKYAAGGQKKIDINDFVKYVQSLAKKDQNDYDKAEFENIHKCAFMIWKSVLLAKDYNTPRTIARDIVNEISICGNRGLEINISQKMQNNLEGEFESWTEEWQYGKKQGDLKAKILFINLFHTNMNGGKLILSPTRYTFATDKLQLDHLEADKPDVNSAEKYFYPQDKHDNREKSVNCLGNFMILDSDNNNNKDNKPLEMALQYYDQMCPSGHWLIEEIKELLNNSEYSKEVKIAGKDYRIPNEKFFSERKARLQKYFLAILKRGYEETEMPL